VEARPLHQSPSARRPRRLRKSNDHIPKRTPKEPSTNTQPQEGYNYGNQSITTAAGTQADLQTLFPVAKKSFFDRLYQLYPLEAYNSTFWQRQYIFGDFIINCPTYYMASAMADAGQPAYKLIFNAGTQLHGATSAFIFSRNDAASMSST
jgi:hypothetical protein